LAAGGGAVDQVRQIADAAQLLERRIALEPFEQHDRLGQLALADVLLDHRKQAGVERLVEVGRVQLVAQPLIGRVVEQERAEQRLLGLEVVRGVREGFVVRDGTQVEGGDESHELRIP
jgi:hypothetical protein